MAGQNGEVCEANSFPESKEIKYCDSVGDLGSMKPHSSVSATSGLSGEQAFEASCTIHGPTLVYEADSKSHEAYMQLLGGAASRQPTSMKSDISTEIGAFSNGTDDAQQRTESSCSNSLSVMFPVSLSNYESSKEVYLFRNYGGSTDNSKSKAFDLQSEELVTVSSESGVSAQIARKAIRNARARNSLKISYMAKKEDENKWESRNASSTEEQQDGTLIGKSSVCSGNSDYFNHSNNTEENIRARDAHDDRPTSLSGERMISSEVSGESEFVKGKPPEMDEVMDKNKDELQGNESFELSMMQHKEVPVKNENEQFFAGFDLNEDTNEMDGFTPAAVATIPSESIIRVAAKAGVARGLPAVPLKFGGGLGWKGSSETSAFRPPSKNYVTKNSERFTGIDLNVAAIEDSGANEFTLQNSHSQDNSERTKKPCIDLNCVSDTADEFTQSEKPSLLDLNMNVNPSTGDTSDKFHWLGQGRQYSGNKTSDYGASRQQEFNFASRDYSADLRTVQHLANNAHPQQYMVPATLQPNLPYLSHTLPPQSYLYKVPYQFGTREPLPFGIHFSSTIPYARYSHEQPIFYDQLNPGIGHTPLGNPHFQQIVHGQNSSNFTASTAKHDVKTEKNLSMSGSKVDEAGQFLFLAKDPPMGDHMHRQAWYPTSMKRKEPEGGLDFHLGYRQVT